VARASTTEASLTDALTYGCQQSDRSRTGPTPRARLGTLGTAAWLILAACGGPTAPTQLAGGTLDMSIDGLPASATPSVRITGPSGYDATFTSDAAVALPPGSYAVIPGPVSNASAIYRAATRSVEIVTNATSRITVTYAQPSVLFNYDDIGGADDNVTPALTANGFDVTFTTAAATFDTEVAGGGHDLVIAMVQSLAPAFDLPTLQAYVDGGGRAIGSDWGRTAGFGDVFDAGYTGATNLTLYVLGF
jgi:hypothetical protein